MGLYESVLLHGKDMCLLIAEETLGTNYIVSPKRLEKELNKIKLYIDIAQDLEDKEMTEGMFDTILKTEDKFNFLFDESVDAIAPGLRKAHRNYIRKNIEYFQTILTQEAETYRDAIVMHYGTPEAYREAVSGLIEAEKNLVATAYGLYFITQKKMPVQTDRDSRLDKIVKNAWKPFINQEIQA